MEELIRCQEDGYEAYLLFVIQMKGIREFEPNWSTHPQFGEVLQKARNAGRTGKNSNPLIEMVPGE